MDQDEIRAYLGSSKDIQVVVAAPGNGSLEVAWGDTFFSPLDKQGKPKKMPQPSL